VVAVMQEVGLDLTEEFPRPLTDEAVGAADVVIMMGCGDACPRYPGKRYLEWELDDPAGQSLEVVRRIRDDIRDRVEALLRELATEGSRSSPAAPGSTEWRGRSSTGSRRGADR